MKNDLLNYNYEVYKPSKDEHILCFNEKYFKIGELMFNILFFGKKANSIHEIYSDLANNSLSEYDLQKIIENTIKPIFNSTKANVEPVKQNYWIQKEILNASQVKKMASPLNFLYGRLFYPAFICLVIANLYFAFLYPSSLTQNRLGSLSLSNIIISYLGLFIIILLHELGHASASIKAGVTPRNIGLGFYTVLPVMYTDLTDAWKLKKESKIKINLGGIYIQLFLNLFLISAIIYSNNPAVVNFAVHILFTNSFIIALNLVPFLKFDGYWIISDLLSIPNMIDLSNTKIKSLFVKKDPFSTNENNHKNYKNYFIWVYTVLRVAYITMMIVGIFSFIALSFIKTALFISSIPYLEPNFDTFRELGMRILNILIIYLFTKNYTKMFIRFVSNKLKK